MESVEDADSVLVTGCQYGTGSCYMDAFIEDSKIAFRLPSYPT